MKFRRIAFLAALASTSSLVSAQDANVSGPVVQAEGPEAVLAPTCADTAADFDPASWGVEGTDLTVECGYVMGVLDNGMRYIIRRNGTPEGTALVRMEVATGRFDERDNEVGAAHYVEHMAFNGSTNVPEGEMVKLLEREGLAFGADTNAATSFHYTQYKLDLPRNDADLLDTALFLMRETASELIFDPEAVERERGILLAEQRDRTNYALQAAADQIDFFLPDTGLSTRFPLAGRELIDTIDAATLKGYWQRNYRPDRTTLVVVGDIDVAVVEAAITKHFSSWKASDGPPPAGIGSINSARSGETDIYLDPALDTQIAMTRFAPWEDRPDTQETRRENTLRSIGNAILARRFTRLTRAEDPVLRGASYNAGDVFEGARETTLSVDAIEGRWQDGMAAAIATYRQFFEFGVTQAEIDEQLARRRTGTEDAVKGRDTRSHGSFVNSAIGLARDETVPTDPQSNLALFERAAADATPETVMAAMRRASAPLTEPLIRFQGSTAPEGGADALRAAWETAMAAPVEPPEEVAVAEWAYTDFGEPGKVVSDTMSKALDIRQIVFDNGVMLNLKRTELDKDSISVSVTIDGGSFLDTREEPLKTDLTGLLAAGGLGAHSQDELQSILAGKSANFSIRSGTDRFDINRSTTPRDFGFQMELITAYLTDPGYRPEPITRFRNGLDNYYARLKATPGSVLGAESDPILNDDDPRFRVPEREEFEALDFDYLKAAISDRLQNGAMEVALVGDFDEEEAIAIVARTLGALPQRETSFREYPDSRTRVFTDARGDYTFYHEGEANQAIVNYVWPTRDYWDAEATIDLNMLSAVVDIQMTDALREELGKAYSPVVGNSQSRFYTGYGTFSILASVEVAEVEATK